MQKSSRSIIHWFWNISKSLRLQSFINATIGVVTVGLDFAFIYATKLAIDIATGKSQHTSLRIAALLLVLIIVSQILIGYSRRWVAALLGVKAQNTMQLKLFRRLLQSQWSGRESRHSGDVLNRLERDVSDVTSVVTDTLPAALGVVVRVVGAFFFLYSMDAQLACLLIVIVPVFLLFSRIYVRKMRHITRDVRDTDSAIQSILQESIQHRMVLKTLERTATMTSRLGEAQHQLRQQIRKRTLFSSTSSALVNIGFATGYLITFLWGVRSLHHNEITYGMMIAFIQLVGQIQGPFRDITKFIPIIISAFTAGERLMELEETPIEEEGDPIRFTEGAGIRFSHVTFAYDDKKRTILRDFSFDFPPGSHTAILGETGAGKTTLIRLILALLSPQRGDISIYSSSSSAPISPLTRCNLVYVPQGNSLFSGTVRDNLALGNPDATEEEMIDALRQACADFVLELPEGIDSRVGEDGTGLSEGQAQRISIARALLRKGNILLLDEATSALDSDTEKRLLQNLTRWMHPNQTLLFVTHRTAVIEYCSQILQLQKTDEANKL